MTYVDSNLIKDERVVHKATVHWIVYLRGAVLIAGGGALMVPQLTLDPAGEKDPAKWMAAFGAILILLGLVSLIGALVERRTTELAITSKRIIAKIGLIRRKSVELNHAKVESFNVDQSILGRLLGYGTLVINGTGSAHTPIRSIDDPLGFRRRAMEEIDESQKQ